MNQNTIYSLEKVTINDSVQWLLIRGFDFSKPVLLYIQAGPGLPMIPEADAMERIHNLEKDFIVVYWDQRGCGKSFSKDIKNCTVTLQQMRDDTLECTRYLLSRFQRQKIIMAGFSIGGSLAMMAANKNPEYYSSVVAVGADLLMSETNRSAMEFAMSHASFKRNKKAIKELNSLADKPILTPRQFQLRAKWLTDFGGIHRKSTYNKLVFATMKNMIFSKEYSLVDVFKSIQGMDFVQRSLLPELNGLNLFQEINHLKVPVYFIQGAHDPLVPMVLTEKFFKHIKADKKELIVFRDSSHMPHYEEPEFFRKELLRVTK